MLGTERRNQLYGPHFYHLDLSIFKDFPIFREGQNLQFRAESFNITNSPTFATPAATLGGSNFGVITATNSNYSPRVLQLALKLQF